MQRSETREEKTGIYSAFPGIELLYHGIPFLENAGQKRNTAGKMLVIHYCREGRMDWELENDRNYFLQKGDLSLYIPSEKLSCSPEYFRNYQGVSILIQVDGITTIQPMLNSFKVDLPRLWESVCQNGGFVVERADSTTEHIFAELYTIPEKIRETYTKIKILELLLFISALDFSSGREERPYFRKGDVNKIRSVKAYLTENIEEHLALKDLSERFQISRTLIKSCFKEIYGVPVYSFIRSCRMQKASLLLKATDEKIADIAQKAGYSNASKFSAAFKKELGLSPFEYRKKSRGGQIES